MNDKVILGIAIGDEYTKKTDKMIESFLRYNKEWDVAKIYNEELNEYLPEKFKNDLPFNKCEIGRWCLILELLKKYKTVLYCDGDIYWYDKYDIQPGEISLFPHCLTKKAISKYPRLNFGGIFNIGIMQFSNKRVIDLLSLVINDLTKNTEHYLYDKKIFSQVIPNSFPFLSYDVNLVKDPGYNVAHWNLKRNDRILCNKNGKWIIKFENKEYKLRSFHFSGECSVFINDDEFNLVNNYKNIINNN